MLETTNAIIYFFQELFLVDTTVISDAERVFTEIYHV